MGLDCQDMLGHKEVSSLSPNKYPTRPFFDLLSQLSCVVDLLRQIRDFATKVLSHILPLKIRRLHFDGFLAQKIMEKEHLKIRKPLILLGLTVLSQLYHMGILAPAFY